MPSRKPARIVALGVIVVAAGVGGYFIWRPEAAPPIVGVVRTTEVRVAPEVAGQLATIKVQKGASVRAGDVVAELSADELTASVAQARAALAAAKADRDNVYAGVRAEERAGLASEIAKAKSPRRRPTMTPRRPGQRGRSAPLPTRRSRQRRPRSPCSSGSWIRPFCARRPMASSA